MAEAGLFDVSVLIPARNAAHLIGEQLAALAGQDYSGRWEVVVADNGSTDETVAVVRRWQALLPSLRLVDARSSVGVGATRNALGEVARGRLLAFCDADDVVDTRWLTALVEAAGGCELVGGRLRTDVLNSSDLVYWRGQDDPALVARDGALDHLPYAISANLAVDADWFRRTQGFDARFSRCGEDVDFGWRLVAAGGLVRYAPNAIVDYRLRPSVVHFMRQQWAYGQADALLFRLHRPAMPRPPLPTAIATWWFLASRVHHVVRGQRLRGRWAGLLAYRAGRLRGAVAQRLLFW